MAREKTTVEKTTVLVGMKPDLKEDFHETVKETSTVAGAIRATMAYLVDLGEENAKGVIQIGKRVLLEREVEKMKAAERSTVARFEVKDLEA